MLNLFALDQCDYFIHGGAPAHRSKTVIKFLNNHNINISVLPGNSHEFNPVQNAWNVMETQGSRETTQQHQRSKGGTEDTFHNRGLRLLRRPF